MTFREKFRALESLGIDNLMCLKFNDALRAMSPREFVERIFIDGLSARYIAFGDDFRFGKQRAGDFAFTQRLACLLYTSDAADDLTRVDLGGRRIIKKIN